MANPETSEQDLQAQLNALRSDFAELTKTVKTLSTSYAQHGQERLKDTAHRAQEQFKESLGHVQGEVEQHPLSSLAIAFGVGLIIGKLLDR